MRRNLVKYLPDKGDEIPVAFWNGDKSRLWMMSLSITTSYLPSFGGNGGGAISVSDEKDKIKIYKFN